jgi:hypothetical protein
MQVAGEVDDVVFEFLLDTLERSSDPAERTAMGDKLGIELWRRSPRRFHSALLSEGTLGDAVSDALAQMGPEQIVSGLQTNTDMVGDIAELRPDILLHPAFWRLPEVDDRLAARISEKDAGPAAHALLAAGRVGPAATIIGHVKPADLIRALESNEADPNARLGWLVTLCRDRKKTAAVLATGHVTRMATLVVVAQQNHPDDIPNGDGEDPWVIALRTAFGPLGQSDEDFLAAFLLARALGWESRSQAELLRYSYTRVYKAFQQQRFSRETEMLACSRLLWKTWFNGDDCARLTETVTRRFVEYDLEPEIFGRLTDDRRLAISLFDEAARTGRGRKYLERVRKSLMAAQEKGIMARANYIAEKLK